MIDGVNTKKAITMSPRQRLLGLRVVTPARAGERSPGTETELDVAKGFILPVRQ